MMTSFAFILGVVPLVLSAGAGAEMRRTLGTAVFSGMLGVTLFGIFLTPVFYYVIQWFGDMQKAFRVFRSRPLPKWIPWVGGRNMIKAPAAHRRIPIASEPADVDST